MADDDNYTIEDDEEPVVAAADAESAEREGPTVRTWAPPALIALGVLVVLLAGWCATARVGAFTEAGPDKSAVFIDALTLPLSIVGSLLVVSGVLAFVLRHWNANPSPPEDSFVDADG